MRKLALWILACLLILLFLAGGFAIWFLKFGGGDDLAAGDEDLLLADSAAVPPAQNGFVPLEAAAGLIQLPGEENRADWPAPPAPPKTEVEEEAEAIDLDDFFSRMLEGKDWNDTLAAAVLARNQRVLELIAEAVARPEFQIPSRSPEGRVTYLLNARQAAYLLEFRSRALAREGRSREALDVALQLARLGRRLENGNGVLIDFLVGSALEQWGLRLLRSLVPRLDSSEIRRLSTDLEKLRLSADDFRMVLRREYVFFVDCVDRVVAGKLGVLDALNCSLVGSRGNSSGLDGALDYLKESFVASRYLFKPLRTRRLYAGALRVLLDNVEKPLAQRAQGLSGRCGVTFPRDRTASNGIGAWMAQSSIDVMENSLLSRDVLEASFSGTRVVLAIQAYKLETGALPATLSELVPRFLDAVPRDPYDGQPLRYSREKLRVWSVGRDLVDSGGGELGPDGEWSPSEEDEPTFRIE